MANQKRFKSLWYGAAGSWKTSTALKLFDKAVVIDMEQGTDFYRSDYPQHKFVDAITPQEVAAEISWLSKNKHDYTGLIIDPISIWHEAHRQYWSDVFMVRNRGGKGHKHDFYEMQPKDWSTISFAEKAFLRTLSSLDMNIVLTAHQINEYDNSVGAEMMKKIGVTYGGIKKLDYWADTVIRFNLSGKGCTWTIQKDRALGLEQGKSLPIDIEFLRNALGYALSRKSEPQQDITQSMTTDIIHEFNELGLSADKMIPFIRKEGHDKLKDLNMEEAGNVLAALKTSNKGAK